MPKQGSAGSDLLRPLSVETRSLDQRDRFHFLNDMLANERLRLAPLGPRDASITAGLSLWDLGSIRFGRAYGSGHIGRRVPDKHNQLMTLRKHIGGGISSWSEDGSFTTQPGDIVCAINRVHALYACQDIQSISIVLPLDVLNVDTGRMKSTTVLPAGTLGNRLLSVAMEDWSNQVDSLSHGEKHLVEQEMIGLVNYVLAAALRGAGDDDGADNAASTRGQAMREYLRENLLSDGLSVEHLCSTFGASRASVYREFESDGGVYSFVSGERLRKALFLLNNSPKTRGSVTRVAQRFGYDDPLTFSKSFRRHFGFSPTNALALGLDGSIPKDSAA